MLTSKSDKLAEFLKLAVQPKNESRTAAGAADPALKAKVAKYRGAAFPGKSRGATGPFLEGKGKSALPPDYGRQPDPTRGQGMGD